jgi:hypothetical protein
MCCAHRIVQEKNRAKKSTHTHTHTLSQRNDLRSEQTNSHTQINEQTGSKKKRVTYTIFAYTIILMYLLMMMNSNKIENLI